MDVSGIFGPLFTIRLTSISFRSSLAYEQHTVINQSINRNKLYSASYTVLSN